MIATTEIATDLITPLGAYLRLRGAGRASFLLESVERGRLGRYSFVGAGGRVLPFEEIEGLDVPVVGYLGYDFVAKLEPTVPLPDEGPGFPESRFVVVETLVRFDHPQGVAEVLAGDAAEVGALLDGPQPPFPCGDGRSGPLRRFPDQAEHEARVRRAQEHIRAGDAAEVGARLDGPQPPFPRGEGRSGPLRRFPDQAEHEARVRRAQEHIRAGDAFQIVVAQRAERPTSAGALELYRALRRVNPSPYLFLLELDGLALVGSSPETVVKCEGTRAAVNPIAGTSWLGDDDALLASQKDRAEHVMLVDLGRNDLSRVCIPGTVRVERFMATERYSHVTHLVSEVVGELAEGRTPFELLRACFPAGTVSGAPKVRAMQIISELEGYRRGIYAGAVGYALPAEAALATPSSGRAVHPRDRLQRRAHTRDLFATPDGPTMDTCIAIRTLVLRDGVAYLQAGGGIVVDSDPAAEHEECLRKLAAIETAIDLAEQEQR